MSDGEVGESSTCANFAQAAIDGMCFDWRLDDGSVFADRLLILFFNLNVPDGVDEGLKKAANWCKFISGSTDPKVLETLGSDEGWSGDVQMAANRRNNCMSDLNNRSENQSMESVSVTGGKRRYYGEQIGSTQRLKPNNPKINTLDDLYNILRKCWSKETAYRSCQNDWVPNDPSYGQCAITAMLVHDMFGGTIHRIRVDGGGTHYFNKINGQYVDLTSEQFDLYNIPVRYEPNEQMNRQYCGKNEDTKRRFELLIGNIKRYLDSQM